MVAMYINIRLIFLFKQLENMLFLSENNNHIVKLNIPRIIHIEIKCMAKIAQRPRG